MRGEHLLGNLVMVLLLLPMVTAIDAIDNSTEDAALYMSDSPAYTADSPFEIYFFYSPTCPHCIAEKPYLQQLERLYPQLHVNYLLADQNYELLKQFSERYGTTLGGVPRTFIGDKAFVGYTEESGNLEMSSYGAYVGYKNQIRLEIERNLFGSNASQGDAYPVYDNSDEGSNAMVFLLVLAYLLSLPVLKDKLEKDKRYIQLWIIGLFLTIIVSVLIFIFA